MKKNIHEKQFLKCESDSCIEDTSKDDSLKIVKPDIVFFGEQMPENFIKSYRKDFSQCDCLIVMGTSLQVMPFGMLHTFVDEECPRLLINREAVSDWELYETDSDKLNPRDVMYKGDCHEGCLKIADELGFKEELLDLIEKHKKRFQELEENNN
jgi:NAD-dependent deacetylase sirtuin 2